MVKVEFGAVKDKPWFFYKDGGDQPPLTVFVKEVYGKTVRFDNGESIAADRFYEMCEPAIDEEPMESEEGMADKELMEDMSDLIDTGANFGEAEAMAQGQPVHSAMGAKKNLAGGNLVDEVLTGIEFDANGVPITPGQQQLQSRKPLHPQQALPQKQRTVSHDSPLIALTEKAQMKMAKISVQFEVPTVNKTLFNALIETYPEEEIDMLLEWMITKMGIDNIKAALKQKVLQHYKSGKRDVTS